MWDRSDWQEFFQRASRPWHRLRPPRPLYSAGTNRVVPAAGFSLAELDDAGINIELAERLGLPVDAGRMGAYTPNISALREYVRTARTPS
jgi:ribosomal protein L13E